MLDVHLFLWYISRMKTSMFAAKMIGVLLVYTVAITIIHEVTTEHRSSPVCQKWKSTKVVEYVSGESGIERVDLQHTECVLWVK